MRKTTTLPITVPPTLGTAPMRTTFCPTHALCLSTPRPQRPAQIATAGYWRATSRSKRVLAPWHLVTNWPVPQWKTWPGPRPASSRPTSVSWVRKTVQSCASPMGLEETWASPACQGLGVQAIVLATHGTVQVRISFTPGCATSLPIRWPEFPAPTVTVCR